MIKTTKWKNILIAFLLLSGVVMLFEIIPKYYSFILYSAELLTEGDSDEQLIKVSKELKQTKELNIHLRSSIKQLISNKNKNISSIIDLLNESADLSSALIYEIKPGPLEKNNNLFVQPVKLSLSSGYEGVYNFIRQLEISDKVINVQSITIKKSSGEESLITEISCQAYINL